MSIHEYGLITVFWGENQWINSEFSSRFDTWALSYVDLGYLDIRASSTPNTLMIQKISENSLYILIRNALCAHFLSICLVAQSCLTLRFFATPWTIAHQVLCPWGFPGKNTGVDCHFFLQGIFLTQESNLCLLRLLH